MPFKLVILWSDALLFILLICLALFAWRVIKNPQLRTSWGLVFKNQLAAVSVVVLISFLGIALLDSIHFRPLVIATKESKEESYYDTNLRSVFDFLVSPLGQQVEKTYSAPFSTHLFVKEAVESSDHSVTRMYPPLQYFNAGTNNHVYELVGMAIIKAIIIWSAAALLLMFFITRRNKQSFTELLSNCLHGRVQFPLWTFSFSILAVILTICIALQLTQHYHIFGTDKIGQDVFYQTLKSIRTGLLIGTITTLVMLPFAIILGIMAGYFGGWIDDVIQYIYTTLSSVPGVLLIAAAVLSLQVFITTHPDVFTSLSERADARLIALCIILGITSWTGLCRLLRAETLKLRELDYVHAAITLGTSRPRILARHLLPNLMHIVLITVVLDFSLLVLAEAVLSYDGVGVDPTTISWGNMINSARLELAREPIVWWPLLAAFTFMFLLVLAANLFSDAVRDAFDPRLRS